MINEFVDNFSVTPKQRARYQAKSGKFASRPGSKSILGKNRSTSHETDSADAKIKRLALSGRLSRAARKAVQRQKLSGLSITYMRGNQIVRQSPDGTIVILGEIETPAFEFPSNVAILRK